MQVFRKADSGKAPGGRKKLTFRLLIQRVGRFSETGRAALAGLVLRARDVPLVFQFVLIADGYEADILPERGANLVALTRPALGLSSVRTPASLESFTTENPYLWGIPILLPPNRISGAQFTFEGRTYRFPMNEPAIGNFIHGMLHETPVPCVEQAADHAVFLFRATAEQPYMTFPHAFTLRIAFALEEDGLHQRITVTNDSA